MTKTQIDRLGERLKMGQATPEDLRMLDEFRRSFFPVYEKVILTIEEQLKLKTTGRPAKSTTSISDKLNRESIRLTQIQDITGCRVIVSNISEQEKVVAELSRIFPKVTVIDRRTTPSNGYRAVHVVVESQGRLIEIQIRTSLQHLWAEVSEKFADVTDPAIKYGKGSQEVRTVLNGMSELVASVELDEQRFEGAPPKNPSSVLHGLGGEPEGIREKVRKLLESTIKRLALDKE